MQVLTGDGPEALWNRETGLKRGKIHIIIAGSDNIVYDLAACGSTRPL